MSDNFLIALLAGSLAAFVVWFFVFRKPQEKQSGYYFAEPRPGTQDVPGPKIGAWEAVPDWIFLANNNSQKRCITFPCI